MRFTIPAALAFAVSVAALPQNDNNNNDSNDSTSLLAIVQTMRTTDTGLTSSFVPVTSAQVATTTDVGTTRNTIPLSISTTRVATNTVVQYGTQTQLVVPGAGFLTTNAQGMTIVATASMTMSAIPVVTNTVTTTDTNTVAAATATGAANGYAAIPGVAAVVAGAVAFAL